MNRKLTDKQTIVLNAIRNDPGHPKLHYVALCAGYSALGRYSQRYGYSCLNRLAARKFIRYQDGPGNTVLVFPTEVE